MNKNKIYSPIVSFCACLSLALGSLIPVAAQGQTAQSWGGPSGTPNPYYQAPFAGQGTTDLPLRGVPGAVSGMQPGAVDPAMANQGVYPQGAMNAAPAPFSGGKKTKMKSVKSGNFSGVGMVGKAVKTNVGLTGKATKTTVGLPAKGVKEVFKTIF